MAQHKTNELLAAGVAHRLKEPSEKGSRLKCRNCTPVKLHVHPTQAGAIMKENGRSCHKIELVIIGKT